jgi:hypothetical protein
MTSPQYHILHLIFGFRPDVIIGSLYKIWPKVHRLELRIVHSAVQLKLLMMLANVQCELPDWGVRAQRFSSYLNVHESDDRVAISLFPCFLRKTATGLEVIHKASALCDNHFPGNLVHRKPNNSPF